KKYGRVVEGFDTIMDIPYLEWHFGRTRLENFNGTFMHGDVVPV
ncbi:MAG: hypothetical protein CFH36_02158, partial [Alphaproteobacteria bacterium MarineAlpha9_Bin6]